MTWVFIYAFLMVVCALNSRLLGAGIIAAVGMTVVFPEVDYALGLCAWLILCAALASTRD